MAGMPAWYRWNREREVALWRFFGRWIISPFVGFRSRQETAVYYLTLLWGVLGKFIVKSSPLSFTQEELLWRVPLGVALIVGAYRFVLFPANEAIKGRHPEGVTIEIENAVSPLQFQSAVGQPTRWMLAIFLRVNNSGTATALSRWQAFVTRDGVKTEMQPVIIRVNVPIANGGTYGPTDDIMQKSANSPITTGAIVWGILLCETDETTAKMLPKGGAIDVSCVDVRNVPHKAPSFECKTARSEPAYYPGVGTHEDQTMAADVNARHPVLVAKPVVQQWHYDMVVRNRQPNDPVTRRTGNSHLRLAITNDTIGPTDFSVARDVVAFIQFTRPQLEQADALWTDPDHLGRYLDSRAVTIGVGQTQQVIVAWRASEGQLTTDYRRNTRLQDKLGPGPCVATVRLRGPFVDQAWTMEFIERGDYDIEVTRCEPLPAPVVS